MPNYVKTGTFVNGSAPGISAAFLNAIERVFVQSSGGTELGGYYLTAWASTSNQSMGAWVPSLSRGATPVSVSIDTTIQSASLCGAPSTDHLNANGFHVYANSSSAASAMNVGGNWTITY